MLVIISLLLPSGFLTSSYLPFLLLFLHFFSLHLFTSFSLVHFFSSFLHYCTAPLFISFFLVFHKCSIIFHVKFAMLKALDSTQSHHCNKLKYHQHSSRVEQYLPLILNPSLLTHLSDFIIRNLFSFYSLPSILSRFRYQSVTWSLRPSLSTPCCGIYTLVTSRCLQRIPCIFSPLLFTMVLPTVGYRYACIYESWSIFIPWVWRC